MPDWNENRTNFDAMQGTQNGALDYMDAGLRKHMLAIYNYMASGVLLSGIVAVLFVGSPFFNMAFNTVETVNGTFAQPNMLGWIIALSPLAFVLFMSFGRNKFSAGALQMMFWGYATAMGLSLSTILITYTGESIALTFFATAGAFLGLSLWGYTTKKDISGWGSFMIMGVVGIIIMSLLNAFVFKSSGLDLAISVIGLLIFAGLTAYDTQKLKSEYIYVARTMPNGAMVNDLHNPLAKMVILGALDLYLDFINMFLFLLRFLGNRD